MKATFTSTLQQLSRRSVASAGGKGANLGELLKAKIPVPPGFVVLSQAFDRYLEETDLNVAIKARLATVKVSDVNSVDRASNEIRDMIAREPVPKDIAEDIRQAVHTLGAKHVAVRSSATAEDSSVASWAGELETYLYVSPKDVVATVRKCWSSLFTPRAIFYRYEKKLHRKPVSVGVVVQQMVASKIAGVAFTVHPVTKDPNQMVIEAGWGLGEALVSGQITPDTYVIDRRDLLLLDLNIGEQRKQIVQGGRTTKTIAVPRIRQAKQKLIPKQIKYLAALCERIERHYRHPQDIEWAYDGKTFYITQTRPITTL